MKRSALLLAGVIAIVVFQWVFVPLAFKTVGKHGSGEKIRTARNSQPSVSNSNPSASTTPPEERSPLADTLNSPATDIRSDLRVVAQILDAFRTNFPRDGNPVGNNAEITAVLMGKNKLHLALIPPDHPAISAQRELCDRWGTPFFFHAESAARMDIRSAGPDKKMWTGDDVALSP